MDQTTGLLSDSRDNSNPTKNRSFEGILSRRGIENALNCVVLATMLACDTEAPKGERDVRGAVNEMGVWWLL